jgi:hypothetical protein
MTHSARTAGRVCARERHTGALGPRRSTSARGWTGCGRAGSGQQAEPVSEFATILRNHFGDDASNIPKSHCQPDGLIVFLMPNSISFRIGFRICRAQPVRAVPESPDRPDCGPGKRSLQRTTIDYPAGARRASQGARSESPDWLLRASPARGSNLRCRGPAVAIPSSKTKGFFPLTDVCAKRENSVPTCQTGICVPSSNWFAAPGLLWMAGP